MTEKKIRVLIAKPGLDGHDRGAKVVARALRDDGMEVIYTGLRQTAHNALVPQVIADLRENGQTDVVVFLGGIIPEDDIQYLLDHGVYKVYGPGTDTREICKDIREAVKTKA